MVSSQLDMSLELRIYMDIYIYDLLTSRCYLKPWMRSSRELVFGEEMRSQDRPSRNTSS